MSSPARSRAHLGNSRHAPTAFAGIRTFFASALFLVSGATIAAPTYQFTTDNDYVWESAANAIPYASFGRTCTFYPVDDDQTAINFTGGLTFTFAGVAYSSVRMLSNGRLQFGSDTGAFRNFSRTSLPEGNSSSFLGCSGNLAANRIMDVAWMDLNPSLGGDMSWEQKGVAPNRRVVLSWNAVPYNFGAGSATFQAILYESGAAAYQYKALSGSGSWSSVATTGVQVSSTDYTASSAAANGVRIDFGSYVKFLYQPASTSGSTCSPMTYTVTAQDSNGATLTTYKGTMKLYITTAGVFSLASGKGVFTPKNDLTGAAATYAFDPADLGVAKFNYSTNIAERAAVAFTDTIFPSQSSGNTVSFADNVFVVEPSDPAGADVVAGRPHAMTATLYAKNSSGACGVATSYSGNVQDAWYAPTSLHPSGASAPAVSTSASCSPSTPLPATAPSISKTSNNASLPFFRGVANFYLCPSDVGQYAIFIRDDTGVFASNAAIPSIGGSSSSLSARPFGLWIDSVASKAPGAKPNPSGTSSSGSAFISAGAAFSARVSARKWTAGQDAIKSGTPDPGANLSSNAILPAFAATTAMQVATFTPSAGVAGALSGNSLPATAYAGGAATASLSYSEVGSAQLVASAPSYLGSAFSVPGVLSAPIGRFIPASISLTSSSLTHGCPAGQYSYMGQPFAISATLGAYGATGNQLQNYDQSIGYQYLFAPAWRAVDSANGIDLSARTNLGSNGAAAWSHGSWAYSYPSAQFLRATPGPDGSYDSLVFGLSGTDPDGIPISSMDASFSAAGSSCGSSCNMKIIGPPTKARYGRLEAVNTFGAIIPTLKVPLRAMYWAKSSSGALGWTPNMLDSCTTIPYSAVAVGGYSGGVSSAATPLPPASVKLSMGQAEIPITRPGGPAISGSALLGINLGPSPLFNGGGCYGSASVFPSFAGGAAANHLKSNFCGAPNYFGNPSAKIIWGAPAAKSGSIIFSRESY